MPPQPPILGPVPQGIPRVPGARNLTAEQLREDDIITIADVASTFAQTTLGQLRGFFNADFVVPNMEALAALTVIHAGVLVEGFYEPGDGGGGQFVWQEGNDDDPVPGMIVELDAGGDGRYVRIYETFTNLKWFGAKGDGTTNDTAAFQAAVDFPITLGSGDFGAATLYVPSGTYKIGPITTAVQGLTICGDTVFAPRLTALTAAQAHLIHFTNESSAIDYNVQIVGWLDTTDLASYPTAGLIFEGGTNNIHETNINRCRGLVWIKRGNRNRIWKTHHGFFDQYAVKLGGVDNSGSAAISETRITESTFYSGASSISSGSVMYYGTQLQFATDCGAVIVENCDGGSTVIGAELVDNLGLGNDRGPGFVTLRGYTAGNCEEAGVWIKANGASFSAENCDFSAAGADEGDGIRVDSPTAAPRIYTSDFHNCQRSGIRVTDAWSLTVIGGTFRDIGIGGGSPAPGIGVHLIDGSGKVFLYTCVFDPDLQVDVSAEMNYALRLEADFTGVAHVAGCKAVDMVIANWSNGSDTGLLNTYDNSDLVIIPEGARASDVNQLIENYRSIVHLYPVSVAEPWDETVVVPPEKTLISMLSGEEGVYSTADPVFSIGGGGEERTTHGPTFQGEWWIDTLDRAELRTIFDIQQDTYKVCFETLFLTNFGTGVKGTRGNIRGIFIERLFMYNGRDYGVRLYSDTRLLEIDTVCIGEVLSNTQDGGAEFVALDFGPRVGSGGKNGANVGPGIMYRGKNQVHTWGVLELTAQSWAATGGGQATFSTEYKHGLSVGDLFFIGGSVPTGYNNTTGGIGTTLTAQSWAAGTVTFTLPSAPGFVAGDTFQVIGSLPTGYVGVYTALTVVGNVITAALASDPGASTHFGRLQPCYVCLAGSTGTTLIAKLVTDPGASTTLGYYAVSSDSVPAGQIIYTAPRKMRFTNTSLRAAVDDGMNLQGGADFEFTSVTIDDPGTSNFNIPLIDQSWACLSTALVTASWAVGIITFETSDSHGLNPGDPFTTSGNTPVGYDGNWIAIAAAGTTVTAAALADPGPITVTGTMSGLNGILTAQSWAANVVTFTTTAPHGLVPGDSFEIVNSTPTGYNGVWTAIAGTTGSTLKATLLVDPGASSVLGFLRGRVTFTTETAHGLIAGGYFVVHDSEPDGYNGTFQAVTVPSIVTVTAFRTFNPGPTSTLGELDVPLNTTASGYHFGVRFHGSYRIRGGMLHECYGNGVWDEAIYAMPSTIDGLLVWNSSWGSPGVNSGLFFADGCSYRTLIGITSGTGDHWRHASRSITFAVGNVADGDTLTLNGTTITFRSVVTLQNEVAIGGTAAITVANLKAFIIGSTDANMLALTPTISTSGTDTVLTVVRYPGATGNLYTLAKVGANITLGAPRLGGGTGAPVQKYGVEGIIDGLRNNALINCNLDNNISGPHPTTTWGEPIIDRFIASGTFYGYPGATRYEITCWGAGGGGGGGRRGAAGSARSGGLGGGGTIPTTRNLAPSQITFPVTVTIGGAGTAGAVAAGDDSDGGNGGNGGPTTFGAYLQALGGIGGKGGGAVAINGLTQGATGVQQGGRSFPASSTVTAAVLITGANANASGGGAGGTGGSISTGNADLAGIQADYACYADPALSAPAGPAGVGAGGANGSNSALLNFAGYGGGGGGSNSGGAAGAGGTGGRGSGGGGGGASVNGSASGAGGVGGGGQCSVKAYFE